MKNIGYFNSLLEKLRRAGAWLVMALAAVAASAAPVTMWTVDQNGAINSGLDTASPVIGDGSPESADAVALHGDFPAIALRDGEAITLSGSVTLTGIAASLQQLRFGLFDHGSSSDVNGWLGYFTSNSSGASAGQLRERSAGNTALYVSNTGSAVATTAIDPQNDPIADGTYRMLLRLTRDGSNYDITASLLGGPGGGFSNVWTVNDRTPVAGDGFRFDRAGVLIGGGLDADRAAFSNIDVSVGFPPVEVTPVLQLIGIDFNKNDAPSAPTQGGFRVIAGASTQAENATAYSKLIGAYAVEVLKAGAGKFEFRGANSDAARNTPGGDTTRPFLVSDFIASRDGAITLRIAGLPNGVYLFRSAHLEPFNGTTLGFAEGASATTRTTIEARIGDVVKGAVQPTTLGAAGLNTTFISDLDIPSTTFTFEAVAGQPVEIVLSGAEATTSGDRFVFLNGFEVFSTQ